MGSEQSEIVEAAIISLSSQLYCVKCGAMECVVSLDDLPLDEIFAANYRCDDCEKNEAVT